MKRKAEEPLWGSTHRYALDHKLILVSSAPSATSGPVPRVGVELSGVGWAVGSAEEALVALTAAAGQS